MSEYAYVRVAQRATHLREVDGRVVRFDQLGRLEVVVENAGEGQITAEALDRLVARGVYEVATEEAFTAERESPDTDVEATVAAKAARRKARADRRSALVENDRRRALRRL